LDANFKIYQGNLLDSKIAQAITPVLLLIFWILYLWKSVLSEQNRLRAAILNLEPAKIAVVKIGKTEHFRVLCISKKNL
jgi:F420-0:gamma-glutamyl ligase-like protein